MVGLHGVQKTAETAIGGQDDSLVIEARRPSVSSSAFGPRMVLLRQLRFSAYGIDSRQDGVQWMCL